MFLEECKYVNKYVIKKTKKSFKKKNVKDIKIFLKMKKKKRQKMARDRYKNLSEEEKEKKRQYHGD